MNSSPLRPFSRNLLVLVFVAALAGAAATQSTSPSPYFFTTFAGISSVGSADGTGHDAKFYQPGGAAVDSAGNVYLADTLNQTIRKITPTGAVSTFAGSPGVKGSSDGLGRDARFNYPKSVAIDAGGNLFVADAGNFTIRKITPAGVVTTLAGQAGASGSTDGVGSAARFAGLKGIAADVSGNLYVTDQPADIWAGLLRKVTPAGVVTTIADGFPLSDVFSPTFGATFGAIALDAGGNVFLSQFDFLGGDPADFYSINGSITKVAPDDTRTTIDRYRAYYSYATKTSGACVDGLAFDATGGRIESLDGSVERIAPDGTRTGLAGSAQPGFADGTGSAASFLGPLSLAPDRPGNLYAIDAGNNNVRKITSTGQVSTLAGVATLEATGSIDGAGAAARLAGPMGLVTDFAGNLYVADAPNRCIRKITPAGLVSTLAGMPGIPGSADGTGSAARFQSPESIAIGPSGNLYVADAGNLTIRVVTPAGVVTTLAGTVGRSGIVDGLGVLARFNRPLGVAVDATGTVYVADSTTVIRKISPAGEVTTLPNPHYADGSPAAFLFLNSIAVDAAGNIYVTDGASSPSVSRLSRITPAGVITLIAGGESGYLDGPPDRARFSFATVIALDPAGNIFVADSWNHLVRKITTDGEVTTLAGLADAGGSSDGTGREARFFYPGGIALDRSGNLYVSSGTTIRKGLLATLPAFATQPQGQTAASGATVSFSVSYGGTPTPTYQWLHNGNPVTAVTPGANDATLTLASVNSNNAGDYTVVITNSLGSVTSAKATLTVSSASTPPATSTGSSGGGSLEAGFALALLMFAALRLRLGARGPLYLFGGWFGR